MQHVHKQNKITELFNRYGGLWGEWHGRKSCTGRFYSAGERLFLQIMYVQYICTHRRTPFFNNPKCHLVWFSAWHVQPRITCSSTISRTGPAIPPAAHDSHVCGSATKDPEGAAL